MEPSRSHARPARIAPLAALPVFFDLNGAPVVVAGAMPAIVWKAELLAAAGAHVSVFCEAPTPELYDLALAPPAGRIVIAQRRWTPEDLAAARIAVGALDGEEAVVFARIARTLGVPVNIVDTPHLCTFNFGTLVNRNPVTIAIGTSGIAPVLGQAIRARIEALFDPVLGAWADAGRLFRDRIKAHLPMGPARRAVWRRFAERALDARTPPMERDIQDILQDAVADTGAAPGLGSVALVGAGPGDAQLLTLKAVRVLQSADVILYDRLVGAGVLAHARREAERISVGKKGGGTHCPQSEIQALMIRLALEGKRVVRLKGGDPMIFGRAAEEIAACRAAGIPVEVVPGITAALGAAAELLFPLTDRKHAKRVQFVTGHSEQGVAPEHEWPSLADPWATTVFYMAGRTFRDMLPKLIAAGLDPASPAVIVAAATTPQRAVVVCLVTEIEGALAEMDSNAPRLIITGRIVAAFRTEDIPLNEESGTATPPSPQGKDAKALVSL